MFSFYKFIFFTIFYFCLHISFSINLSFFTGQRPFLEHLKDICDESKKTNYEKRVRFYVNHVVENDERTLLEREFGMLGCFPKQTFQISGRLNGTFLLQYLNDYDEKIEVLLNFYDKKDLTEEYFQTAMEDISNFYLSCDSCKRIIIFFNSHPNTIARWSESISWIGKTPQKLSAIIVTNIYNTGNIIWIRPLLDGCSMKEVVFIPESTRDFDRILLKSRDCNLFGEIINVSVNYDMPFCVYDREGESEELIPRISIDFEIMKILEEKYNFRSRLLELSTEWGDKVNGTWSGIVGDLIYGQANMAICEISIDTDHIQVIDYGTYTFIDQIIFMSQNLALRKSDHLFEHIPPEVLFASGIVFLLTAFSLVVITKMLYFLEVVPRVRSVGFYFMKMFAIAMKQSMYPILRIKHDTIMIIFFFWMLGFLVLSQLYSWIFYSTITAPEFQKPLDKLTDLVDKLNNSDIRIFVRESSSLYQKIIESTKENGLFFMISEHFSKNSYDMTLAANETIELLEKNPNSVFVGFQTFAISNRYLQAKKIIHISSEAFAQTLLGASFSKHSPLKESFDLLIKNIREHGFISRWLAATLQGFKSQRNLYSKNILNNLNPVDFLDPLELTVIYFEETWSLFQIWGIGILFGCGVFLAELCVSRIILNWNLRKNR